MYRVILTQVCNSKIKKKRKEREKINKMRVKRARYSIQNLD